MNSKTLFTSLVVACVAVGATAAPVKQGHGRANGHQSSSGHEAGNGHSDDGAAEQSAPQPVAPQPAG
jgi:hypothetical protein